MHNQEVKEEVKEEQTNQDKSHSKWTGLNCLKISENLKNFINKVENQSKDNILGVKRN